MARTRSVVSCALWADEDWRKLSVGAQWLYLALLGHARLSMAGCLVMQPKRWAQLAQQTDIAPWLAELELRDYVVSDDTTEEVVIRTFVANDIAKTSMPINSLKGLWSAWQAIESTELRQVVVDNTPDVVWEKSAAYAPPTAVQMRRPFPSERPFEREPISDATPVATDRVDGCSNHPLPLPLPSPLPDARPDEPSIEFTEAAAAAPSHIAAARAQIQSAHKAGASRSELQPERTAS